MVHYHVHGSTSSDEVSVSALCAGVADGTIALDTNVWTEGMDSWQALDERTAEISGLGAALGAAAKRAG
eukprot:COSAG04_NODE_26374_length_295_cov_1.051020_1_plen_68_part_01